MPFKHFIQKIEGRLPHYTTPEPAGKPKFPYVFEVYPAHRMREFINGEYNPDEEMPTSVSEAFLWRATPQGHDYWSEWAGYSFEGLPDEQLNIVCAWEAQYDLTLEEVVWEVQEGESQYGSISPGSVVWTDDIRDLRRVIEEIRDAPWPTTRVPF